MYELSMTIEKNSKQLLKVLDRIANTLESKSEELQICPSCKTKYIVNHFEPGEHAEGWVHCPGCGSI